MFIPMFDLMQKEFHFDIHAVMADGIYDSASILIIDTRKATPASLVIHEIPKTHQRKDSQKQETHSAMRD
jgi:hypothetical protein